ncbi:MAG: hypothetical protein ALECFALPRED_008667 [Alectoria fallacina]|uniref:Uncharacterized protein n=1 Tax=Alectoria fallacina TaxID=1903189 RepID=A0A8H3J474_9LECA|nr:MAG: hypothetical protein ALECFALPRED_008667 [Alectoria fallacina]
MRVKQGPAVQAWQIRNNDADMRGSSDQSVEERFELVDRECAWRTGKGLTGVDIGQSFRPCNNGGAKQWKASIGNPIELEEVRTGKTWMRWYKSRTNKPWSGPMYSSNKEREDSVQAEVDVE